MELVVNETLTLKKTTENKTDKQSKTFYFFYKVYICNIQIIYHSNTSHITLTSSIVIFQRSRKLYYENLRSIEIIWK